MWFAKSKSICFGILALVNFAGVSVNANVLLGGFRNAPTGSSFLLISAGNQVPVILTSAAANQAKSLIGRAQYVKITVPHFLGDSVRSDEVPTIISGDRILVGRLSRKSFGGEAVYFINDTPVNFGKTKLVNGTQFDQQSKDFFVGKTVRVVGVAKNQTVELNSILLHNGFSADPRPLVDASIPASLIQNVNQKPVATITRLLKGKETSPANGWFRKTIYQPRTGTVRPGEAVLLITASGGQEDDMGAVNGHFAAGIARVNPDLTLEGELFNVYVTNEKEIVPGNIDLGDYFGNIISGQLNYRPTYTLAIYGLSEKTILKVKKNLDRFHPLFREGNTKITVNKNCATMTVQALADIGIYGEHRNSDTGRNKFKLLSKQTGFPAELNIAEQAKFVAETKRAEFMPGPAFVSLLKNLNYVDLKENLGIQRVDFIYSSQTPSARKLGSAPTTGIINQFRNQGEMGILRNVERISK